MTGTRDPQQDGSIQAMLRDSGLEAAAELRSALEQLRAVVPDAAPAPRADLAALLAAGAQRVSRPVPARQRRRRCPPSRPEVCDGSLPPGSRPGRAAPEAPLAIVGGAVVGAMTLGAGAVAASSEDFRHNVSQTVGVIFQPAGPALPARSRTAPEHAQPSPANIPAVPAGANGSRDGPLIGCSPWAGGAPPAGCPGTVPAARRPAPVACFRRWASLRWLPGCPPSRASTAWTGASTTSMTGTRMKARPRSCPPFRAACHRKTPADPSPVVFL